jgi:hypothetical protein
MHICSRYSPGYEPMPHVALIDVPVQRRLAELSTERMLAARCASPADVGASEQKHGRDIPHASAVRRQVESNRGVRDRHHTAHASRHARFECDTPL